VNFALVPFFDAAMYTTSEFLAELANIAVRLHIVSIKLLAKS
jgi:hypothetical protein